MWLQPPSPSDDIICSQRQAILVSANQEQMVGVRTVPSVGGAVSHLRPDVITGQFAGHIPPKSLKHEKSFSQLKLAEFLCFFKKRSQRSCTFKKMTEMMSLEKRLRLIVPELGKTKELFYCFKELF